MAAYELKHVSKVVPRNTKVLTGLLIAVAVVNSATLGYDSSVMNGLAILPSYTEYFNLNVATTGLNNAAVWVGGFVGCFIMQPIPDYLGRKNAIVASAVICFLGTILQAASQNIAMFIIARFTIGIGSQISSGAAPALLGELLPSKTRGRILGFFFSCYYVGSLIVSIINYGSQNIQSTWSWRLPSLLQFIPSLISLGLLPFVPESPRWLISKGQHEYAREVLMIVQGNDSVDSTEVGHSFNEIDLAISTEKEVSPGNPWVEIGKGRANQKRLAVLVSFGVMIQMFGNFVVSFYLGKILTQAGITSTKTQTQIQVILSCWSFFVACCGSYMLDHIGRRVQTLVCIAGMIVSLFVLSGMVKTFGESTNNSGIYGTIAVIFFFQGFYAFSITPMTSLYPTEICQYKLRITGIAIFRLLDNSFGLMASFAMGYAMENLGWKFYIINASYNILFFIVVFLLWPETKGLTLEEITMKFEGASAVLYGGSNTDEERSDTKSDSLEVKEAKEVTRSI